jgi:hypothetical protein
VSRVRLLAVGIAVMLASGGCASASTARTPMPATTSVTPEGLPGPSGPPLGTAARADNGQVEATVFAYRPPRGTPWAAADVQVCVVSTAIFDVTISQGPWLLLLADGPGTPPTPAPPGTVPQPAYPTDHRRLHPGECVRGWLSFAVPDGGRPVAVQYSPAGADALSWPIAG